jgi:hypothetical protein
MMKERLQEALNHTCGFLNESLFDAENDHILDLSPISRKKKINNAKKQKQAIFPRRQNPFKDYYKMKGVFWNSRGLSDLAKHRFLDELVREEQINFIALSEIGRESFPDHVLKNLCVGRDFLWHAMAPHGRSGGILFGVDLSVFDIGAIDEEDFYVKFTLRYKSTDFKFVLYSIYGPAQSQNKGAFLAELANTCSKENLPFLIGEDFNIMRKPEDKSSGDFDTKWPSLFNAVIESLDLREIVMTCR